MTAPRLSLFLLVACFLFVPSIAAAQEALAVDGAAVGGEAGSAGGSSTTTRSSSIPSRNVVNYLALGGGANRGSASECAELRSHVRETFRDGGSLIPALTLGLPAPELHDLALDGPVRDACTQAARMRAVRPGSTTVTSASGGSALGSRRD